MDLQAQAMLKEYVTNTDGVYRVADTRVSLDSVVYLFREGMSAESIVDSYAALTLEQVHGALAFYLGNQPEVDWYLSEGERAFESDSRLTRTAMGVSCAVCAVPHRRSISAPLRMRRSPEWKIA